MSDAPADAEGVVDAPRESGYDTGLADAPFDASDGGACAPGETQCFGSAIQTCNAAGQWGAGVPCAQPTPECIGGACACSKTMCPGGCADLQTDNANCGACGLACSTMCTSGECVVTLASGQMMPQAIAIDATSVYWATGVSIMRTGLDGGTPTTLAARDGLSLAVDSASIYWTSSNLHSVLSVPIAGGTPVTLCPSNVWQTAYGMAVNGSSVYWVAGSALMSVPLAGGTPVTIEPGTDEQLTALDATHVYWATILYPSRVLQAPLDGGTPTTLGSGGGVRGLAVNGASVFWSDHSAGTIMSAPLGGGSAVTLVSGQQSPGDVAIDGANIYWVEQMPTTGAIVRAPLAGGVPYTVASGVLAPLRLAVDGTSVYWLDGSDGGRLMKVTPK